MSIESNEEAYKTMRNSIGSMENRMREIYNKGYKDGIKEGINQAMQKIADSILEEIEADRKTEPQYDFGEYADRLWKIAYERGKREALEQIEPSCDTCKLKGTTEWCKRQEVCRAYQPKTEPQTSCKTCRYGEVDEGYVRCAYYSKQTEPQTDWHYDEQDATWYPYKHEDEPQQKSCATCKHALGNWDGESNNCGRCCGADRRFYEPIEDEPQTDNGIGCSRCEGRYDCYDRDMPHAVNCNNYGKVTDEPQTERSE